MNDLLPPLVRMRLQEGIAIPACPLALNAARKWDEYRQRTLLRYYFAAGAGGLAVGVHTTQFAIRDPSVSLYLPMLQLAQEEFDRFEAGGQSPELVRVGGICGDTPQALTEASALRRHGFHLGLLSLRRIPPWTEKDLLSHCRAVSEIIPLFGFYLQPAIGGPVLPFRFWRALADLPGLAAIKIAPFNRYQTLDVLRAVAESGRSDVALYTGNDDQIVLDLITPWRIRVQNEWREIRIVGGLLGHWAFWTRSAAALLEQCRQFRAGAGPAAEDLLRLAGQMTDVNAAVFDAANGFAGCIAGVHEILRRQGLLEGIWCLDPEETLSPGQSQEIDRVIAAYPHLNDDDFVSVHLHEWMDH